MEVARIKLPEGLSLEGRANFIEPFILQNKPCIIEGLMNEWKAMKDWSPSYLKSVVPADVQVKVFTQPRTGDFPHPPETSTFHEFLTRWEHNRNEKDVFLGNKFLKELSSSLIEDVKPFPYTTSGNSEEGRIWIGQAGHHSHLHYDAHDGFLCCVEGEKEVWLYEPLQNKDFIKSPMNPFSNASLTNPLFPDFDKFPEFKNSICLMTKIIRGEILLIPMYWWHFVISPIKSIAVNFWQYPFFPSANAKFEKYFEITKFKLISCIFQAPYFRFRYNSNLKTISHVFVINNTWTKSCFYRPHIHNALWAYLKLAHDSRSSSEATPLAIANTNLVFIPILQQEIAIDDEPPLASKTLTSQEDKLDIYFSSHPHIRLQPCGAKGLGLFVHGGPIRTGEPIWWCDPVTHPTGKVWNRKELEALEPDSDWFWHWAYRCGEDQWLGPSDKDDPSREATYFQNHSCDPSTWWVSPFILTARRDLEVGDEITYDYGTSECDEEELGMEHCLCGSPLCRDKITGSDYMLPSLIERYGSHFQPYLLERQHKLGLNLNSTALPQNFPEGFVKYSYPKK